jgi:hypothetical protein
MRDLFDYAGSSLLKQRALTQVGRPKFISDGLLFIEQLPVGGEYSGEDIRRLAIAEDIVPHHHNAWGALISQAIRRRLLKVTGKRKPLTAVKGHARKTDVYVRI